MPGSAVNLSDCNMILNTAVAKSLKDFADACEGLEGAEFEKAAIAYIRQLLTDHQRIIFNGNGYSDEWEQEATRRGLANHRNTAEALPCFISQKSFDLFAEFGILSENEVRSRYEVKLEKYNKLLNIEARVMIRMARRTYLPAISRYMKDIADTITSVKSAAPASDMNEHERLLSVLVKGTNATAKCVRNLIAEHDAAEEIEDNQQRAYAYANRVIPAMDALREEVDALECIVEHDYWPVPTYNDILFYN
jgi:glutamine synthetase